MYSRPLVPADFVVPQRLDGNGFILRPLTVNDLIKDYDAVMASAERLAGFMNPQSPWPRGLTLEEDLIDLGWHQREFTMRHSFAYTVISPDEGECLGCCYILPSDKPGYDAQVFYWARTSTLAGGFEERLGSAFRGWIAQDWPFARVAYPGRDIPWSDWPPRPPHVG
ncbi:MAG TPA: hypothetical protein VFZ03_00330 [Dongiaceae bacterium]